MKLTILLLFISLATTAQIKYTKADSVELKKITNKHLLYKMRKAYTRDSLRQIELKKHPKQPAKKP